MSDVTSPPTTPSVTAAPPTTILTAPPVPNVKKAKGRPKGSGQPAKPKKPRELTLAEKADLPNFPEFFMGEKIYPWQRDVLSALNGKGCRVALKAANGSGKTSGIVRYAILWHMIRFPGAPIVVTAGVYRQLSDVLQPLLKKGATSLGGEEMGWKVTENKIYFHNPGFENEPAHCVMFRAEDPEKAEGWHARGPHQNLLYVIDEAKSVSDKIFQAMERCQPTRVLVVSSPGGCAGAFYDIFRKPDERYQRFTITAHDCPHITKEWIAQQIAVYGERSPLIRSMIHAEFSEETDHSLILPPSVLQKAISSPPAKDGNMKKAGVDFAAGGDENVIQCIEGNKVIETVRWREKDTMAAVGRFLTEFKRLGLEADNIYADGGGLGLPMCDALREAGWDVHRVQNGAAATGAPDKYADKATEMWMEFARMVELNKVILPSDDEVLHRQLTNRILTYNSKGKLKAETKLAMKARGVGSPDRADALVLAFCGGSRSLEQYVGRYGMGPSFSDITGDEAATAATGALAGCWAG
jgi:phage terminase large subunit